MWKQVLLPLTGAAALVATGVGILGGEVWAAFIRVFAQVVLGALSPLEQARVYLQLFQAFVGDHGFIAIVGLVCAKLGAVNLLPLVTFNGVQAGAVEPGEDGAARGGVGRGLGPVEPLG